MKARMCFALATERAQKEWTVTKRLLVAAGVGTSPETLSKMPAAAADEDPEFSGAPGR